MKITIQNMALNTLKSMKKNNQRNFTFLAAIALSLLLCASCNNDNAPDENFQEVNTLACKNRPGQISFGNDTSNIVYNEQDKPIEITNKKYNKATPAEPPVITVFKIDYNALGNADKVSKSIDGHLQSTYQMEYDSAGKLIKQSEFNALGALVASTTAHYDQSNVLTGIITQKEGTSVEVTTIYQYADGNLIKKSIENLYDLESQEYYDAYFQDSENKVKPYFEGPLGLLFVSNLANQQSLQYLNDQVSHQLFFAKETLSEKKMLKNIEIIAHRYATRDTTNIDYTYDYDTDGFPTSQKGIYKNITRRYVPTPFGGSALLVTPHGNTIEGTINFYCN
jgi:uncharacterized protein (DUF2141 family)